MFSQFSKHGRFDINIVCKGDLHIDDHHTAEDCALALGEAFDLALGKREKIKRFGNAYCPLDESLSRVIVDISSRAHSVVELQFTRFINCFNVYYLYWSFFFFILFMYVLLLLLFHFINAFILIYLCLHCIYILNI
jgi:imidazoleglycerol phosphate dehydratase HisB